MMNHNHTKNQNHNDDHGHHVQYIHSVTRFFSSQALGFGASSAVCAVLWLREGEKQTAFLGFH